MRRISETLTTPLFSSGGGPVGGGGGTSSQTYTDREYVWAPPPSGYVDECICQIDRNNAVRYVIQDASYDVVAIVAPQTGGGNPQPSKVIGQYTWDPYGQVLTAEYSGLASTYNKLGHHGLFADRLDAGYQSATLQPGFLTSTHLPARIIYSVRNRTYDPSTQRWLQRDPNATGQVVLGDVTRHSGRMNRQADAIDLSLLYGDGMSGMAYVGSSPTDRVDAAGLMIGDALNAYGTIALTAGSLARDLVSTYAANQESDAEWASDWSINDEWHTRSDASWINDLYASYDIDSVVNDYAIPGIVHELDYPEFQMGGRWKGVYQTGTRLAYRVAGLIGRAASHHAFFRFFTQWKKGVKEIVLEIPEGLHRGMHTFVDRYMRSKVEGLPSIYDPRGEKVWGPWIQKNGHRMPEICRAMKDGSKLFFRNRGIKRTTSGRSINEIIDEAFPD